MTMLCWSCGRRIATVEYAGQRCCEPCVALQRSLRVAVDNWMDRKLREICEEAQP